MPQEDLAQTSIMNLVMYFARFTFDHDSCDVLCKIYHVEIEETNGSTAYSMVTFVKESLGINELTHCGLLMSYSDIDWSNIGPGDGLLPDGTMPLPEPMLTQHQQVFWHSPQENLNRSCSRIQPVTWIRNLTDANELRPSYLHTLDCCLQTIMMTE